MQKLIAEARRKKEKEEKHERDMMHRMDLLQRLVEKESAPTPPVQQQQSQNGALSKSSVGD